MYREANSIVDWFVNEVVTKNMVMICHIEDNFLVVVKDILILE